MSDVVALQHEIIPSWASLDEAVFYVMEHNEQNYNNMMRSIAIDEIRYVMEAGEPEPDSDSKIKKIKDAIVKWLSEAFESLKSLYNSALQTIKKKLANVKERFNTKAIKAAEAKLDKLKDKEYGFTYDYDELDKAIKGSSNAGTVWKLIDDIIGVKETAGNNLEAELESAKSAFLSSLKLDATAKESAIRSAYMNFLRSGNPEKATKVTIDKAYLKKNFGDMAQSIRGYDEAAGFVKSAINRDKKAVNQMINDIKKDKKTNSTTYGIYIPYLKFVYRMVVTVESSILVVLRERLFKNFSIVARMIAMSTPKDPEKEVNTESAMFTESSSYQSELASLFDWNF